MPWYKPKEILQTLQIIASIIVIISFLLVVNQYSLLKQEYEWKFGAPEVIMYNDDWSSIYQTIGQEINYKTVHPKNNLFICNSRGRPILLMGVYPEIQGPMTHHPEPFNYSSKILRQNDCENLKIKFSPINTIDSNKVDGNYTLNVTVFYFDDDKNEEIYFTWKLFEIKNNTIMLKKYIENGN